MIPDAASTRGTATVFVWPATQLSYVGVACGRPFNEASDPPSRANAAALRAIPAISAVVANRPATRPAAMLLDAFISMSSLV